MLDSTYLQISPWSYACFSFSVKISIELASIKRKSYHSAEFFCKVFCKNLKPCNKNSWQIEFSLTNLITYYFLDSKSLLIPAIAFIIVPLLTSSWNSFSKPLLSNTHKLVKILRDYRIWVCEIFWGIENSVSIYLTGLLKSMVWFHYLKAFSTVKTKA